VILGTAGHIDHGKTTLVHRLTGVDTDRLPEEKRRGITIELGFAPLDLGDVGSHRGLPHPLEPATGIGDVERRVCDPRGVGSLRGGICGLEPEVVELADRREAGGAHLAVHLPVERAHRLGRLTLRLGQHPVAPGPEVAARGAPAKRPLERVAVRVHEARERDHSCHGPRH